MNILTPTFIHAPGLGPDLKGVRFSLDGPVCWGVLGRQAWQGLRGGRGSDALAERGRQGRVHGRVCVGAPVAGNAMLGAVLTVLSRQLLQEKQINIICQLKVSCVGTPVKMEAELRADRQVETKKKWVLHAQQWKDKGNWGCGLREEKQWDEDLNTEELGRCSFRQKEAESKSVYCQPLL